MATLYIAEFGNVATLNAVAQIVPMPPLVQQTVAIGASAAASSVFNIATRAIRVHTDSICSIAVGTPGATATAVMMRMAADQTEYFGVQAGQLISVISNT